MTAIVYLGEILIASLLAIVLLAISHFRMSGGTALFVGGVVGWTLAEYLVHRFVLHGLAPSQHGLHHANPDEAVLTIFWQIWICFAVAYLIAGRAFVAGALAPRLHRKPLFRVLADPEIQAGVGVGAPFVLRNAVYDQRATHDGFLSVLRLGFGAGFRM